MQNSHGNQHTLSLPHAHLGRKSAKEGLSFMQRNAGECFYDRLMASVPVASRMSTPGLLELRADAQRRVERAERALKDQSYAAATKLAHPTLGQSQEIVALEANASMRDTST